MTHRSPPNDSMQLRAALAQMVEALRIVDDSGAPAEIGAELSLAVSSLEQYLGIGHQLSAFEQALCEAAGLKPYGGSVCSAPSAETLSA